ncbi:hypothetical protein BG015_011798 [Linnemannia schmuckeri]|uniref:K Homology domain-containing protein n=1 Tax=Linnemannia schmuckeri TaxID=64567 RepID=A0A9P5S4H1_9FUNG|nr:hypothetical protein BG015_011798 [Linnemannia schmuckeri]
MSESTTQQERKRALSSDEPDAHDSDLESRRHKRHAMNDTNPDAPQRPLHRRETSDDIKMSEIDDDDSPPVSTIRALVSTKEAGVIIGKSGKNVKEIRELSGARVNISEMISGAVERVLTVVGPLDAVAKAFSLIAKTTIAEQAETDVEPESESTTMRILAGNHKMGSVIGKGGSKIKEVQEASGARITALEELLPNSTERVVSITGVPDAIHIAVYHIGLILEEKTERDRYGSANTVHYKPISRDAYGAGGALGGYGASRHGGGSVHSGFYGGSGAGGYASHLHAGPMAPYSQEYAASSGSAAHTQAQQIFIPNDMVGSVIGKGGSKINEIRKASGSQISIADQPNKSGDERLVTITGTPESNQMAIYLLYSRLESEKDRQQN